MRNSRMAVSRAIGRADNTGMPACRAWLAAVALCGTLAPALAQPDPSQEPQRQRQRERERLEQLESAVPDARLPALPQSGLGALRLPPDETPCFPISRLAIASVEGGGPGAFGWLRPHADRTRLGAHDPVAGRCLGARGIERLLARLQDALVARGYVTTRVQVLAQDLSGGQLAITLVPGRIGAIRLAEAGHPRATLGNAFPMRAGDVLRLRDVEQALENLRRVPTADAGISIEPGGQPGQSDLVVGYRQGFPFCAELSLDDSGSKATGKRIGSLALSYDNWWTLNDLLYASFSHSLDGGRARGKATRSGLLHYSIPYGHWLLTLSYGDGDYRQTIAGATQDYLYRGSGSHAQASVSRVLWRNGSNRLNATARLFQRRARNYIDDVEVEVQRRTTAGWELGVNHRAWLEFGTLDLGLGYRRGTGAFGAIAAPEQDFGEGSARFKIWTAEIQLAVPFALRAQRLAYSTVLRAQLNRIPLAPQERFSIGGRYTVRGFDGESLLSGDRGVLLRNEVGWAIGPTGQQAYPGLDWGRVGGQAAQWLIGRELAGAVTLAPCNSMQTAAST